MIPVHIIVISSNKKALNANICKDVAKNKQDAAGQEGQIWDCFGPNWP